MGFDNKIFNSLPRFFIWNVKVCNFASMMCYKIYVLRVMIYFQYVWTYLDENPQSQRRFFYILREKSFKFVELFLHSEIWLKRLVYFESYQIFHFSLRHLTSKCTISMPGRYIETKMDFSIFLFLISDSLDFNSINVQLKNYKFFLFLNFSNSWIYLTLFLKSQTHSTNSIQTQNWYWNWWSYLSE